MAAISVWLLGHSCLPGLLSKVHVIQVALAARSCLTPSSCLAAQHPNHDQHQLQKQETTTPPPKTTTITPTLTHHHHHSQHQQQQQQKHQHQKQPRHQQWQQQQQRFGVWKDVYILDSENGFAQINCTVRAYFAGAATKPIKNVPRAHVGVFGRCRHLPPPHH